MRISLILLVRYRKVEVTGKMRRERGARGMGLNQEAA